MLLDFIIFLQLLHSVSGGFGIGPVLPNTSEGKYLQKCPPNQVFVINFKSDDMILFECQRMRSVCGKKIRERAIKPSTSCKEKKEAAKNGTTALRFITSFRQNSQQNSPSASCMEIKQMPKNFLGERCKNQELRLDPTVKIDKVNSQLKIHDAKELPTDGKGLLLGLFKTGDLKFKSTVKRVLRSINLTTRGTYVVEFCSLRCERKQKDDDRIGKKYGKINKGGKGGSSKGGGSNGGFDSGKTAELGVSPDQYQAWMEYSANKAAEENSLFDFLAGPNPLGPWYGQECFSNDQLVETPSGAKRMDALKIGDKVAALTEGGKAFEPILSFSHFNTNATSLGYRQITTRMGYKLTISNNHLLFLHNDCERQKKFMAFQRLNEDMEKMFVFAERAKVGHCMQVWNKEIKKYHYDMIVKVEKMAAEGLIAPMTLSGTILVNGVLASCYSNLENQDSLNEFFTTGRYLLDKVTRLFGWSPAADEAPVNVPLSLKFFHGLSSHVLPRILSQ